MTGKVTRMDVWSAGLTAVAAIISAPLLFWTGELVSGFTDEKGEKLVLTDEEREKNAALLETMAAACAAESPEGDDADDDDEDDEESGDEKAAGEQKKAS